MTTFQCDHCETTQGVRVASDGSTYVAPSITCEDCFSDDVLSFDDLPTTDTLSQHAVALYEHDMAQYRAEMAASEQMAGVSDDQLRANLAELNADMSAPLYHLRTHSQDVKRQSDLVLFYGRELARRAARSSADCGGDLVHGTGCGKCSHCTAQASIRGRCGYAPITLQAAE